MFFAWGSQRHQRTFFNVGAHPCPQCGVNQTSDVVMTYTVRHVWYLFRWVSDKACEIICATCQVRGRRLDVKSFEAKLTKPAIPFMDRMGWSVGLGIVAALVACGGVAEALNTKNDLAYLRTPMVGDVYEIDFRTNGDPTCADCRYGTALVTEVDPQGAYVHFGKTVYNKISGARDMALGPRAHDPGAYGAETFHIPTAKLIEMRQQGDMMDVIR